jgi:quercetin dioxygenase-like cupin family protein
MIHTRTLATLLVVAAGACGTAGARQTPVAYGSAGPQASAAGAGAPHSSAATHTGAHPAMAVAAADTAHAQQTPPLAKVTELMTKPLADYPGKEALLIEVEYPPGGADPVHRHDAHAIVYVLEGSIVMGVRGAEPVTLTAGQTFYEGPDDIHTIGRNASTTEPAKFVVFLLKNSGAPVLTPVQ